MIGSLSYCNAENNLEDTYAAPKNKYIDYPKNINKSNDCLMFKKKGWFQ